MDTALILAGGASIRMGRPKALEAVAGKTMVRRVFDALAPLVGETLVSVADTRMAKECSTQLPGAQALVDRTPRIGPIEGIARGAEIAQGERILVAPCDAPFLQTDLYRLLLVALGDHEAAVPRLDVMDPVRAVYRRPAVLRVLKGGTRIPSPSALVDRLDAVFLDRDRLRAADPDLVSFMDVNTSRDLEQAVARTKDIR